MEPLEQVLVKEIIANPDDDFLRLVYADWLDEHAVQAASPVRPDSRLVHARFIRDQVQPADGASAVEDPSASTSSIRDSTTQSHQFAHVLRHWGVVLSNWQRGFPTELHLICGNATHIPPCDLMAAFPEVFACCPVRFLRLVDPTDTELAWVTARPELARLRDLRVSGRACPQALEGLVRSPHLSHLRTLCLGGSGADGRVARAIAGSLHLGELEVLILNNNQIGDSGTLSLAASKNLRRLHTLDINRNGISSDAALEAVATSSSLPSLKCLKCRWNDSLLAIDLELQVEARARRAARVSAAAMLPPKE